MSKGGGKKGGGIRPWKRGNLLASLFSSEESELCDSGELTDGDAEFLYSSRPKSISSSFVFMCRNGGGKCWLLSIFRPKLE